MYPKWKHHCKLESIIVLSPAHETSLGDGWADLPPLLATVPPPVEPPKIKGKPGRKPKVV